MYIIKIKITNSGFEKSGKLFVANGTIKHVDDNTNTADNIAQG